MEQHSRVERQNLDLVIPPGMAWQLVLGRGRASRGCEDVWGAETLMGNSQSSENPGMAQLSEGPLGSLR